MMVMADCAERNFLFSLIKAEKDLPSERTEPSEAEATLKEPATSVPTSSQPRDRWIAVDTR